MMPGPSYMMAFLVVVVGIRGQWFGLSVEEGGEATTIITAVV